MIPIAVSSYTPYDGAYESGKLRFGVFYSSGIPFDIENMEKVKLINNTDNQLDATITVY